MTNSFESTFPADFRERDVRHILNFVMTGKFCQLVCVPGGGKATLLKLLAYNQNLRRFHLDEKEKLTRFIYINLLELANLDQLTIDEFLLHSLDHEIQHSNDPFALSKQLKDTVSKTCGRDNGGQNLILLFDHFDEFQNHLSRSFFQTIRGLKNTAKYKFACVFATRRDLGELIDEDIRREFYDFFIDNTINLAIYDKRAIDFIFSQAEAVFGEKFRAADKEKIIAKTGGHAKLTKVAAESFMRKEVELENEALFTKPIVAAALFEIWLFLTAQEQRVLTLITQKKQFEQDSTFENLVKFDLIKGAASFTIPLFYDFVKITVPKIAGHEKINYDAKTKEIVKGTNVISDLLSPQEYRLLSFLIENEGRIVARAEIIEAVWPEAQVAEGVSDEAIDQMVFRIRRKIEDEPNNPRHIATVKGLGWRFRA